MAANPALEGARARAEQARHRLNYEEGSACRRCPARHAQADREMSQVRVGVSLTIPPGGPPPGPVREAEAEAARTTYAVDSETYTIRQRLQIALRQYDVAQSQVQALENGVVSAAQAAARRVRRPPIVRASAG
jgi:cobalt-zinc-cadmium efflux system outer membrane protein